MALGLALAACAPLTPRDNGAGAVEAALARYRDLTLHGDSAGLAALFDAKAQISHGDGKPVVGQPAILVFFKSFAAYRVLDYELRADTTSIAGTQALQRGGYRQRVRLPSGETVSVQGRFEATWMRVARSTWRLLRMHTESA